MNRVPLPSRTRLITVPLVLGCIFLAGCSTLQPEFLTPADRGASS